MLGLAPAQDRLLRDTADAYIHNAWPVNFNQPLKAFEDSMLMSVRDLLKLVEGSPRKPHLHYMSSVSTVGALTKTHGSTIPETLHEASVVQELGYAEPKFVAKSLCGIAARRTGLAVSIHRVSQLGGPLYPAGVMWNPRDWLPALVRSSMTLGKIPDDLGAMKDVAAQAIVQIVHTREEERSLLGLKESFGPLVAKACRAKIVSLQDWVDELEQQAFDNSSRKRLEALPGLPLLGFFKSLVAHPFGDEQRHCRQCSPA
ncbi:uncharacterized protein BO97DRAFT_422226 [Aspergillus homomorphus CBS 101889]|uniref:Thioester reductase (TE) domain-containing protein n=1 Tax=Aspergillus homomorphus (strain CBS 101889) TaxID=1450537 RepID=A0A395I3T9_ASPHC|nr:hypothetical protein BO97DRAFT_422226 [Aspergillus homomorphus CBS 101889]RAL14872.1 hypothetical protein BO97DRAFT_422226 [Aspergillus homomorphus CBS 101889]